MHDLPHYNGYDRDFLGPGFSVKLPQLTPALSHAVAPVDGKTNGVLDYQHFSLVQHAQRRFPIFTAANVDGNQIKRLTRHDRWRLDPRIHRDHQWGSKLYAAHGSDFDRGHMTKREDVQWGHTEQEAKRGALSTFYYPNAVPQVAKLNQQLWRSLEDYILHNQAVGHGHKIVLLTGPVLSPQDPVFVTKVDGQQVKIPTLFWKIIYFTKADGQLYHVGFLMGQAHLLEKLQLVHPRVRDRSTAAAEGTLFMDFAQADVFQVKVATIQKLTALRFTAARAPFQDDRPIGLIRREVQVKSISAKKNSLFTIEGLAL